MSHAHLPVFTMELQLTFDWGIAHDWTGTFKHVAVPRVGDQIYCTMTKGAVFSTATRVVKEVIFSEDDFSIHLVVGA